MAYSPPRLPSQPAGRESAPPNAAPRPFEAASSQAIGDLPPFNRPPRIIRELPREEVQLPAPPRPPTLQKTRLAAILAPLVTVGVYVLVAFLRGTGGILLILPIVTLSLVTVSISIYTYIEQRRQYANEKKIGEDAFTITLNRAEQRIAALAREQWEIRHANNPSLNDLFGLVQGRSLRLWERRPDDHDFLHVRVGLGNYESLTSVKLEPSRETTEYTLRLYEAQQRHQLIKDVPYTVALPQIGSLGIAGGQAIGIAQALIWQIVTHHSPDDVRVIGFWPSTHDSSWEWLKSLPHTRSLDGEDSYRMLANSDFDNNPADKRPQYLAQVFQEIERELKRRREQAAGKSKAPYLIIVLDNAITGMVEENVAQLATTPLLRRLISDGRGLGASVLCLVNDVAGVPSDCGAYLDLSRRPQLVATTGRAPQGGVVYIQPDAVENLAQCVVTADVMLNIPLAGGEDNRDIPARVNLFELLNIADVASYVPASQWKKIALGENHPSGLFPVPIGKSGPHAIMELDLNEKREGVHGMIAGTTGSGKSELLTTLLLGLAIKHSPDQLHFLLIDFKAGATFGELARLPHTAGFITDLSGSQAERALTAINSELDRRKKQFSDARVKNIRDYRLAGKSNLPNLVIAIDEFDEMVNDHEDVVDELIRVAKQGRSLGVHLLFATQQPSTPKIKPGLRTNLTYWLALRVGEAEDSKAMLNTKDAALITNATPGRGYKRVGERKAELFQSAMATFTYTPPVAGQANDDVLFPDATGRWLTGAEWRQRQKYLHRLTQISVAGTATQGSTVSTQRLNQQLAQPDLPAARTEAEVMIETLRGDPAYASAAGQRTYAALRRPIWDPPLTSQVLLSQLPAPGQGGPRAPEALEIAIGYVDYPELAQKQLLFLNLLESGSVLMYGAPGAGKTSALRTCALALAAWHDPAMIGIYIIDSQGWGLGMAADIPDAPAMPHIADTMTLGDVTKIERLINILNDELAERKTRFQEAVVDNWKAYCASPTAAQKALPALVVMIDNLIEFAEINPTLMGELNLLVREGARYGLLFLFTADRPATAIPSELKNSIATRLVLRLNSEDDSSALLNKPFAGRIAPANKLRGYVAGTPLPREIQVAYPTLRAPAEVYESLRALHGPGIDDAQDEQPLDLGLLQFNAELARSIELIVARHGGRRTLARQVTYLDDRIAADPARWPAAGDVRRPRLILASNSRDLQDTGIALDQTPHFMIAGGPRSGKSNVLQALLAALVCQLPPAELSLYLLDYRNRPLRAFQDLPHTRCYVKSGDGQGGSTSLATCLDLLQKEIAQACERDAANQPISKRIVMAISNVDLLEADLTALGKLARWVPQGLGLGVHFFMTSNDFSAGNPTIKMMRQERSAIVLGNHENASLNGYLGLPNKAIKWPATLKSVPGRGFLVEGGHERMVQFWQVDDALLQRLPDLCRRDPDPPADDSQPDPTLRPTPPIEENRND